MSTITLERTFCKYCKGELFIIGEKRLEAHKECLLALPYCDKCNTTGPINHLRHVYNPLWENLCMKCTQDELTRRATILLQNIQSQYSLDKNNYTIKVEIKIEEVTQ